MQRWFPRWTRGPTLSGTLGLVLRRIQHTLDPIAECAAFHMHTLRAQGITAPAP